MILAANAPHTHAHQTHTSETHQQIGHTQHTTHNTPHTTYTTHTTHQNVRTADPTCTTHFRSDGLVCHSRSDLRKADCHHHYVHTRHLALPLVSLPPLFALDVPQLNRFRMNANSTAPVCVVPKPSIRNLFGRQEVQERPSAPSLLK